jgi:hypothetical protein
VKPKEGYMKLNVDASFHPDRGTGQLAQLSEMSKASSRLAATVSFLLSKMCILLKHVHCGMSLAEAIGCNKMIVHSGGH